ncbi:thioesterase [candidate division KSB1 bacterium]|nr:thioesterase [candidate division KSB1 bacterium]
MKPGLHPGLQTKLHIVIHPKMTVDLGGKRIHPFYSTYTAAHHAELAARLMLEPFLEPDEEGIGSGLTIHHHSPALAGQEIDIIVTATRCRAHHLAASYEILHGDRLIANGEVHQVILAKTRVQEIHRTAKAAPVQAAPAAHNA